MEGVQMNLHVFTRSYVSPLDVKWRISIIPQYLWKHRVYALEIFTRCEAWYGGKWLEDILKSLVWSVDNNLEFIKARF